LSPSKPSGTTKKFTVTFDDNGATSGMVPNAQTVQAGSSIKLPGGSGLSKTGFTFGGWNTNAYGTGINYSAGSSFTPTANITLYAKWDVTNIPKTFVITDVPREIYQRLENSHMGNHLGVYKIGTTLEQALKDLGEVAFGGHRSYEYYKYTVTCLLYDYDVFNSWTPESGDDSIKPWSENGTFDVYWMITHLIYTPSGGIEMDFAEEAYKFSSVNFSSETITIPFSNAIQVAP
jgi:uncharacterized repeat protein (TIGR02543 family)